MILADVAELRERLGEMHVELLEARKKSISHEDMARIREIAYPLLEVDVEPLRAMPVLEIVKLLANKLAEK